jgi:hypothetical protein
MQVGICINNNVGSMTTEQFQKLCEELKAKQRSLQQQRQR